jgi:hypothetical protein
MKANLAVLLFFGLAFQLALNCEGLPAAHAQEMAAETLATQLRRQGHRCEAPVNAQRDAERSRPDEVVWIVKCANGAYRMRLMPHGAAQVEQI